MSKKQQKTHIQKPQSQEFFPRASKSQFVFNKAPINKRQAKEQLNEQLQDEKSGKSKRRNKGFIDKLYSEDIEDEEMKVFNFEHENAQDNAEVVKQGPINKRKIKEMEKNKVQMKSQKKDDFVQTSKINQLKFNKGALSLFAINEIHDNYLIVNYTRNVKGFIQLSSSDSFKDHLEVGQLIIASTIQQGTTDFNLKTSLNQNKKIQLSLDLTTINRNLTSKNLIKGMVLQGVVESREAKGFLINLGFKDKTKGFCVFKELNQHQQVGNIVSVLVNEVNSNQLIVKCDFINDQNCNTCVHQNDELTMQQLKPGFLVHAKVSQLLENGIEVSFLGGFTGTIFQDHLDKTEVQKYKVNERIIARIITIDHKIKQIALSTLSHIVKFKRNNDIQQYLGKKYENVKVIAQLYGDSYLFDLGQNQLGFLHKIHQQKSEDIIPELQVNDVISSLRVKEINLFDQRPILSQKEDILNNQVIDYNSLKVGDILKGKITMIDPESKFVSININQFVQGKLYLEHMSDFGIKTLPPKFNQIGKEIKIRVWNINSQKRLLELTKKPQLLKEAVPVYQSYSEVPLGSLIYGVIVDENEYGYVIKSFGDIKGLLTFQNIKINGKKLKQDYKKGNVIQAYVLFKKKDKGFALTLDKKEAKQLLLKNQDQSKNQLEINYFPNNDDIDQIKQKQKFLLKNSSNKAHIGKVFQFRILEEKDNFYVLKSIKTEQQNQTILGILPKLFLQKEIEQTNLLKEVSLECLVIDLINEIPFLSNQDLLLKNISQIPQSQEQLDSLNGQVIYGIVNETNKEGLTLRFLNGFLKPIQMMDVDEPFKIIDNYKVGEVIKSGFNKLGRLSLKNQVLSIIQNTQEGRQRTYSNVDLVAGNAISGQIKSIKGACVYVHLHSQKGETIIGRLHVMESENIDKFKQMKVGDRIIGKVLKVFSSKKKTWIEITMKSGHMKTPIGLNETLLQNTIASYEDLEENVQYDAYIHNIDYQNSYPIQLYLSPFVKGAIHFSQIVSNEDLVRSESNIIDQFKIGSIVKVYHRNGKFSLLKKDNQLNQLEKGSLVLARYVKISIGKGVTCQIQENTFGFIEISEITDEFQGQVLETLQKKLIFIARIIDTDKNGKYVLSTRESILDQQFWELIKTSGKTSQFQKLDEKNQKQGNQRNKIMKFGYQVSLLEQDLCFGYIVNIGKSGCFIQIGHNCTLRASLNELTEQSYKPEEFPLGKPVIGRIVKTEVMKGSDQKRFHLSLKKNVVIYGVNSVDRNTLKNGDEVQAFVIQSINGKVFAQIKGSSIKIKVKNADTNLDQQEILVKLTKVTKYKITSEFLSIISQGINQNADQQIIEQLWNSVQEEAQKDIVQSKTQTQNKEIDDNVFQTNQNEDEIEVQMEDLKELNDEQEDQDSDAEVIEKIIKESKMYSDDEEEEEIKNDDLNNEMNEESDDDNDQKTKKSKGGKKALKDRIKEEKEIRAKEKRMRDNTDSPKTIDDFERLLFQNQNQSYVWIQYIAFIIDTLGIESARKIAERSVKSVSISNEEDKFNLWIAFINLENNFGTQDQLQNVIKRALEVNDRKKVYLQVISIFNTSKKYQYIEDLYKLLVKKYSTSSSIWSSYLEFLFQVRKDKQDQSSPSYLLLQDLDFSEPKQVLSRALQSLPKQKHVLIISKVGQLEFKYGQPENGRTMFEGIITNYPKRMDIWAIYMDMEVKYATKNNLQQVRNLFERCLKNEIIRKKPKNMKLVFQKYMVFESEKGNQKNVEKIRKRVDEYLDSAFGEQQQENQHESDMEDDEDSV